MRKDLKPIQLTSYEDLLGINQNESDNQIVEIPLSKLRDFHQHPFYVKDDDKMKETARSIREHGVLVPAIVRPLANGNYEIVSGHRRKRGCELAGKKTIPAIIKNYSDDEAVIVMVDSNIQRENLLPSEKAWAYRMKMEAIRHQGNHQGKGCESADEIGRDAGDSGRTVQRYIRLTYLIPQFMDMVDSGKIKFTAGVFLSYLKDIEQYMVLNCFNNNNVILTLDVAEKLKKLSERDALDKQTIEDLLCAGKRGKRSESLSFKKIQHYFPKDYSCEQMEEVILQLLDSWNKSNT